MRAFAAAGVGFVYSKASGGNIGVYYNHVGKTGGGHEVHIAAARAAGLPVGHYHFNGRDGSIKDQIAALLRSPWRPGDRFMLDVEDEGGVLEHWNPTEVVEALDHLFAAKIPASDIDVYMSAGVTFEHDWRPVIADGVSLMVAAYDVGPVLIGGGWEGARIRQYTSDSNAEIRATVYDGDLDLNRDPDDNALVTVWSVRELQKALNAALPGITPPLAVDNRIGPATRGRVGVYQKAKGLHVDESAGPVTLGTLTKV